MTALNPPIDDATLRLLMQTHIDVAVARDAVSPLEPLAWSSPQVRPAQRGMAIDVHRFATSSVCSVQLIIRIRFANQGQFAFHLIYRARESGFVAASVTVQGAPATEFWDWTGRCARTWFSEGRAAAELAVAARRLIAGQGFAVGGTCALSPGDRQPARVWHANAGYQPAHVLVQPDAEAPMDWGLRERGRIEALGVDVLHMPISGAATNPGQTGGQADFCFAPLELAPEELRRSVWQELCRPSHWTETDGTPIGQQQHPQLVLWNGTPHRDSRDKLGLPPTRWHGANPDVARTLKEPRQAWASYDRQHWSINHLCAYAALVDDPVAWELVRWQVEQWLFAHPVGSGTTADNIDSPRGVGRGMAAAVKLAKLLQRAIELGESGWGSLAGTLWERILGRANAVHAQLLRNLHGEHAMTSEGEEDPDSTRLLIVGADASEEGSPEALAMRQGAGDDLGAIDPDLAGLRAIGGLVPGGEDAMALVDPGPVLEVRGPEGHGLPKHPHWRPWEEAIAAWGMALVADLTQDAGARFVADLLALHVVLRGYRESDWQIAHAMVWPVPADLGDLVQGDTVMWADGTDFRWWARPAVAYLRYRVSELLGRPDHAASVEASELFAAIVGLNPGAAVQLDTVTAWLQAIATRCSAILATVPLPTEITLQNMWQAQWRSCWD